MSQHASGVMGMSEISAKEAVEIIAVVAELRMERDRLAAENAAWVGSATYGTGSPCMTPSDLEKAIKGFITEREAQKARIAELECQLSETEGRELVLRDAAKELIDCARACSLRIRICDTDILWFVRKLREALANQERGDDA